ncbi:conserved Plasmodium membrane protein, unknown function [Plasmodium sp. gorilla clade G3]|nr:conserved Plasmodium membrane protein, unknown function [Plasmodium sp. gorilla clade G3]
MGWFGKMEKCCCFPLAGGCLGGAMFHFMICITSIFSTTKDYKNMTIASNAILGCLIVLGLVLKNFIVLYIVALFVAFLLGIYIIIFVFLIIALFAANNMPFQHKLLTALTVLTIVLITASFLNIYISTCRVIKSGGTGWEYKSYMEIEKEKERENKEKQNQKKKEDAMLNNDYNA